MRPKGRNLPMGGYRFVGINQRSKAMEVKTKVAKTYNKDVVRKAVKELIKTGNLPDGFGLVSEDGAKRVVTDPTGKKWEIQGDKRM